MFVAFGVSFTLVGFTTLIGLSCFVFYKFQFPFELNDVISMAGSYFIFLSVIAYITLFCLLVLAIKKRFEWINKVLLRAFQTEYDERAFESDLDVKQKVRMLSTLAMLHDFLCEAIAILNQIFSVVIACFIAVDLVGIAFSLFEFYVISSSALNYHQLGYCINANLWNFYIGIYIFGVICSCSLTMKQGQLTLTILQKALHFVDDDTTKNRVLFD